MINAHRLSFAQQYPSPNYNARPDAKISLVVIHNISLPPAVFDNHYIEQFFNNQLDFNAHPYFQTLKNSQVSAHLLIKRDGSILQFVPFDKRAWHAGESNFNGRENCNDFSIGIELQGSDDVAYEKSQYKALIRVIKTLKSSYPITDIIGHSAIAPGRKTDPGGAFEWEQLYEFI